METPVKRPGQQEKGTQPASQAPSQGGARGGWGGIFSGVTPVVGGIVGEWGQSAGWGTGKRTCRKWGRGIVF